MSKTAWTTVNIGQIEPRPVPDYVKHPVQFDCLHNGRVMLGEWGGDAWVFHWSEANNCWVSKRKATVEDLEAVERLRRKLGHTV